MRHSLHWKPNQAPWFYGLYAVLIGTTFWPVIALKQSVWGLAGCTVLGIAAAALLVRRRPGADEAAAGDPGSNRRPPGMDRAQWRQELRERRAAWRTPRIDTLQRPALSMARRIGLLTLRGYIIFAIVIMVIKLVQVTTAHH
jgi:hypothetical protein